jgi:hypothetical protein
MMSAFGPNRMFVRALKIDLKGLRLLDWIIEEFVLRVLGGLLQAIFYWPGWLLLRLITIGNYPPEQNVQHNRFAVALFAVFFFAALAAFLSID